MAMSIALVAVAQDIGQANTHYTDYESKIASGDKQGAYDDLHLACEQYLGVLNNSYAAYSETQQASASLAAMYPHLANAVVYFSQNNNPDAALKYAEDLLDISLHDKMAEANLPKGGEYPTFAYFAASKNYNARNYVKAVKYLDAYIKSGDAKNLKPALHFAGKSYIYLNQPQYAKEVLKTGLQLYPNDPGMLTTAINLLADTKDDDETLQTYVTEAMSQKPSDEALMNIQGLLYERNKQFGEATKIYQTLRQAHPNNLEISRHLSINLYNSGVQALEAGDNEKADLQLRAAAEILNDVLTSDPLAINYAYALANAYNALDDKDNLVKINEKIIALGYTPVGMEEKPAMMAINKDNGQPIGPQAKHPVISLPPADGKHSDMAALPKPKSTTISDVDREIPVTERVNENAFAVIIANGDYQKVANVDNAENDGKIFAEYCHKVLGMPKDNIRAHYNTTYGDLLDAIEDIKSIAKAKRGNLDVVFYYAGHGIPNEETKTGYLLPTDADGKQMRVCYPLRELYNELADMGANNTYVFLDACFSGATRNNDMLMSARSVAIDVDPDEIDGNVIVFSAASGSQTALANMEQNHGMFTYYLLKKLQETKGAVDLGSLSQYIEEKVSLESQLKNKKQQTPTVIVGTGYDLDTWKSQPLLN